MIFVAVVPARGGSVRVPRKNLEYIGNQSIADLACGQAQRLGIDWCLSTDDAQIAQSAAMWFGWARVHGRNKQGDGPMAPVLVDAMQSMPIGTIATESPWADAVVCLQPTSPFRRDDDIRACMALLASNSVASSVVSVDETTGERNGAVYVTRVSMLRDGLVFDEHSLKYPMPHERSIDINTPEDLERARAMWDAQHRT